MRDNIYYLSHASINLYKLATFGDTDFSNNGIEIKILYMLSLIDIFLYYRNKKLRSIELGFLSLPLAKAALFEHNAISV